MLIREIIQKTTEFFRSKDFNSCRLEAELLIGAATKMDRLQLYLKFDQPLTKAEVDQCRDYVRRRAQGEPTAYILGSRWFYELNFNVNSSVLIPRPETEQIVELALAQILDTGSGFRGMDMGCGSGCIGISLLKKKTELEMLLVEKSELAIEVARANADKHQVSDRATFMNLDCGLLEEQRIFDFVVGNPPYISKDDPEIELNVKKFEPEIALFANDNGLLEIKSWAQKSFGLLKSGGFVLFEIGYKQGATVKSFFEQLGFEKVEILKDLSNKDRIVFAVKGV